MSDSFVTPWSVASQVPLSMVFPRQEYWSGLPFPSAEDISDPGIEPMFSALPGRFFTAEAIGKPKLLVPKWKIKFTDILLTYLA